MTDLILELQDGSTVWPYSVPMLRRDEPTKGFSDQPTAQQLAQFGVYRVQPTDAPVPDPATERVEQIHPVKTDGVWVQAWHLVPLTQAEQDAIWRAQNPPEWIAFANALPAGVRALLRNARLADEVLGAMLEAGLGKAADGDSRVFIGAWQTCAAAGLVSSELAAELIALAEQYHLPAEFIAGLEVQP
jgi:hypothetical protein